MGDRERLDTLPDKMPEYEIKFVLSYARGITAKDEANDLYCKELMEDFS